MSKIVIKTLSSSGWTGLETIITAKTTSDKIVEPLETVHPFNAWEHHRWSAQQLAFHILGEDYIQYDQETFCWTSNEYIHIFTRKTDATTTTDNGA